MLWSEQFTKRVIKKVKKLSRKFPNTFDIIFRKIEACQYGEEGDEYNENKPIYIDASTVYHSSYSDNIFKNDTGFEKIKEEMKTGIMGIRLGAYVIILQNENIDSPRKIEAGVWNPECDVTHCEMKRLISLIDVTLYTSLKRLSLRFYIHNKNKKLRPDHNYVIFDMLKPQIPEIIKRSGLMIETNHTNKRPYLSAYCPYDLKNGTSEEIASWTIRTYEILEPIIIPMVKEIQDQLAPSPKFELMVAK